MRYYDISLCFFLYIDYKLCTTDCLFSRKTIVNKTSNHTFDRPEQCEKCVTHNCQMVLIHAEPNLF